jgi:hypothetical protein
MRLWFGYGSEHSMNLVMIGQFKSTGDAESAKQALDDLMREVQADADAGNITVGEPADRFSDRMLSVLSQVSVWGYSSDRTKMSARGRVQTGGRRALPEVPRRVSVVVRD